MRKRKAVLFLSLWLNVVLILWLLYSELEGCVEIANGRIGVLTRDVEIGLFDDSNEVGPLFKLPKGLAVREASATGAGRFEPYRFRIVVTSSDQRLVDYKVSSERSPEKRRSEYYSARASANAE